VDFFSNFFKKHAGSTFKKELRNILGFKPGNISLYKTALTHRSVREGADENNERLEYLGDAVLSAMVADYLFKRYPYKEEGFLTEMRSKMVNRQQLNEIAIRMGLKKVTLYNKMDGSLKVSQIFGNTLEALVGAVYLDFGYKKPPNGCWITSSFRICSWMTWRTWRSTIKINFTAGPIKMANRWNLKPWMKSWKMAVASLLSPL
jgi:ribonuclease-3